MRIKTYISTLLYRQIRQISYASGKTNRKRLILEVKNGTLQSEKKTRKKLREKRIHENEGPAFTISRFSLK